MVRFGVMCCLFMLRDCCFVGVCFLCLGCVGDCLWGWGSIYRFPRRTFTYVGHLVYAALHLLRAIYGGGAATDFFLADQC